MSDEESWLERTLPVIRTAMLVRSFQLGAMVDVIALYRDRLILGRGHASLVVCQDAYTANGAGALRSCRGFKTRADLTLAEVESFTLRMTSVLLSIGGDVECTIVSGKRKWLVHIPSSEATYLVRALQLLLGDRLILPSNPEAVTKLLHTKGPYADLVYRDAQDPIQDQSPPRQPFRSKPLGAMLVLGAVLLIVAAFASLATFPPFIDFTFGQLPEYSSQITFGVIFGCAIVMNWLGRSLCRPNAAALLDQGRRSILYLRSFRHDGAPFRADDLFDTNPQIGGLLKLFRLLRGRLNMTFEQHLDELFRHDGPVVAIGKPGERLQTAGAARLYVGDSDWQEVIRKLMRQSQVVVVQVGPTEGTWWEVNNAYRHVNPKCLLWLLTDAAQSRQCYDEFRAKVEENLPIRLPKEIGVSHSKFLYFDESWTAHPLDVKYRAFVARFFFDTSVKLRLSLLPFLKALPNPVVASKSSVFGVILAVGLTLLPVIVILLTFADIVYLHTGFADWIFSRMRPDPPPD